MLFKGIHWTQHPEAKKIKEKIRSSIKAKGKDWLRERALKGVKARKGTSWNKGLPKNQQPRYGKPVSKKQIQNMRKIGKLPTNAWNKGIVEWSPRLTQLISAKALARDNFKCTRCETENDLVVHHIVNWKQMKDKSKINDLENLQTLCRRCHFQFHIEYI